MNAKTNIKEHTLRVLFYVALLMEFSPRHSEPKVSEAAPSISEVQSESPMGHQKSVRESVRIFTYYLFTVHYSLNKRPYRFLESNK